MLTRLEQIERIESRGDLAAMLQRLRGESPRAGRATKLAVDKLASGTGIPRSTLYTYLNGQSLPSLEALAVLGTTLGASPAEQKALARAWNRLTGSPAAASRDGKTLTELTTPQLDEETAALLGPDDSLRTVGVSETFLVGADRMIRSARVFETYQAQQDGADGIYGVVWPDPEYVASRIRFTDIVNFRFEFIEHPAADTIVVWRKVFGRALAAGELTALNYAVDYTDSYRQAGDPAGAAAPISSTDNVEGQGRSFRHSPTHYELIVQFSPSVRPAKVWRVYASQPSAPALTRELVQLNDFGAAELALRNMPAGSHGLEWEW
ncbi:helix-turn-helix domain-containing protein [Nakamurella aerolata]|uniref:Helix-turn-helix transcriptional regulator n=1 Tax=Nakamurella aerolata TaxID=1656892 RepID=A0A849A702_9ACTN|nr:helix-turn-helix transcriptional regulator [Nakamurella aerolata]NNG35416.1 helix-turn-helix transcriptional regulator [Nakamurella aerolata]